MTKDCAVCYVSDLGFHLPSIISAAGFRRFVSADKADIFIFTVGVDEAQTKEIDRFLAPYHIRAVFMEDHVFRELDKDRLTRTYTPTAMFGRLFMDDLLPATCRRIIYLDGDTWIERDPTPLVETPLPEGRFAAAEDTIFFRQRFGTTAKDIRRYFSQLGLEPKNGYLNSGVFVTSRNRPRSLFFLSKERRYLRA